LKKINIEELNLMFFCWLCKQCWKIFTRFWYICFSFTIRRFWECYYWSNGMWFTLYCYTYARCCLWYC